MKFAQNKYVVAKSKTSILCTICKQYFESYIMRKGQSVNFYVVLDIKQGAFYWYYALHILLNI